MAETLGAWLRQHREARGWTRREMARQLIQAGRDTGDKYMPGMDSMCHNIHRWERGRGGLTERYKLHYCRAFGIAPGQFGADPAASHPLVPALSAAPADPQLAHIPGDLADPRLLIPLAVAYRGRQDPQAGDSTVEREVLMAAHEGSDHAQEAERRDIGEATLEQLRADVARLSVESMTDEPFPLFLEMRRVRDRIYRLLEQRLWPRDQADLYFLLGCLADLMAAAASELGYPQAAEELIRSGWAYATVIDHRPLMAHLRLQHGTVLFWHDRPREARDLAEDGLRYLGDGPNAAHLHLNYARAAARLGDADAARRAITAAQDAREREHDDDLQRLGGEFSLSLATHHYVSGAALAEIENGEAEAAGEIERAADLYAAGPEPGEQHWFGGLALARIELAAMRLRTGALEGAAASLEPVLSLPPEQRITAITTRLTGVRTELAAPIFRGSAQARTLDEQIEEFSREAITAGLHSLPGPG
jgi:transcriptional regulator with XRE-family HTH domain